MSASILKSNKAQRVKKFIPLVIVLAVAPSFIGGGSSSDSNEEATKGSRTAVSIANSKVYAEPKSTATESASSVSGEESVSDEEKIKNDVKNAVRDFSNDWFSYDYHSVKAYNAIAYVPVSAKESGVLKGKYDAHVKVVKEKEELSTADITSVKITALNYSGTSTSGAGDGKVRVQVKQKVSNKQVGSAGSTVSKTYEVSVKRTNESGDDGNRWLVMDISEVQ